MPYHHDRVGPDKRACHMPFSQVRCPACGDVVGFAEVNAIGAGKLDFDAIQRRRVFCSTKCVDAVPCSME
ncbi:hypothetical protein LCGC14_2586380, partial [marine sediment metagenome]